MTFQFFGSSTMRVKFARSRRMTLMTVSLPSADLDQRLTPRQLVRVAVCPPRHVVNGSNRLLTSWAVGRLDDVNGAIGAAGAGLEAGPIALFACLPKAHGPAEEIERGRSFGDGEGHRVEAANRMLGADRTFPPGRETVVGSPVHELQLDAIWVCDDNRVGAEPLRSR